MTSIERTAYPYISADKSISKKTLDACYALTKEEFDHINQHVRGNRLQLNFAIQLKTFQNLGYFVDLREVPSVIADFLKKQLRLPHNLAPFYKHATTLSRHRKNIRDYLQITSWGSKRSDSAQRTAIQSAHKASQTLNYVADIINVVVEELITKRFELPSFQTLDRLVRHTRATVNAGIFQQVYKRLEEKGLLKNIEPLLILEKEETSSAYQKLKRLAKSPTVRHFKEQIDHHNWLTSLGSMDSCLKDITKVKIKQFAEEAKSLDINNLNDLSDVKKYTLVACLIHQAQQAAKDDLGTFLCKTLSSIHKRAKRELEKLQTQYAEKTQELAKLMLGVLTDYKETPRKTRLFSSKFKKKVDDQGGIEEVENICQNIITYNSKNHLPLLWSFFRGKRSALFDVLGTLPMRSSTQNNHIIKGLNFAAHHRHSRSDHLSLPHDLDLGFVSEKWKRLIYIGKTKDRIVDRRSFELCVHSYLASELRSGDIFIEGADSFSDYRQHLLNEKECDLLAEAYLQERNLPKDAETFVEFLRQSLSQMAQKVDNLYPNLSDLMIEEGIPVLKKVHTLKPTKKTLKRVEKIHQKMPERSLLDIICLTHHLTGWAHEFGPLSGVDSRLDNPVERYILNVFCQGTGMGPTQGAKHMKENTITPRMLSWINRRHVITKQLDKAKDKLINYSQLFLLTTAWGDHRRCAADGTLREIYEDNLLVESHFRYKAKGGIAYNHIADTYVALFSTFIPCGVWEAVEILEGLVKNQSNIRPDTLHADSQGQSTVVFGLAYLLGIKLMPRIRNWKDLTFFRPSKQEKYENIESLFGEEINWELIKTHWKDLLQVVLSIKQGKISTSFLLRKLTSYSRKNRLYQAFQELGKVIRTQFLLEYVSNAKLREIITASTNKVEAYNALSDWIRFGSKVIVASNDPDEMEKAIKYNALIANCLIVQNIIDYSVAIYQLQQEGYEITKEDATRISPYRTEHLKRFGEFIIDLEKLPENTEMILNASLF